MKLVQVSVVIPENMYASLVKFVTSHGGTLRRKPSVDPYRILGSVQFMEILNNVGQVASIGTGRQSIIAAKKDGSLVTVVKLLTSGNVFFYQQIPIRVFESKIKQRRTHNARMLVDRVAQSYGGQWIPCTDEEAVEVLGGWDFLAEFPEEV